MGHLILDKEDLQVLATNCKPEMPAITVADDDLEIEAGPVKLDIGRLDTHGAVENKGVRVEWSATYHGGRLKVEFS